MGFADLKDDVVVVTGAAQGIGAAYARRLADEGATVIAADRNLAGATRVAAHDEEHMIAHELDVSSAASCRKLAEVVGERFGRVDGLVNNAAIFSTIRMAPFWEITEEEWDAITAVNIKGVWLVVSALLDLLRVAPAASIVNIGSDSVVLGRVEYLHYIASKAAVTGMTYAMAKELGGFGIRVNTLSPGPVYTEVARETVSEEQSRAMLAAQAIKRKAGPDDMTSVAAFLLSDESGYVTGQTISVNAGLWHR